MRNQRPTDRPDPASTDAVTARALKGRPERGALAPPPPGIETRPRLARQGCFTLMEVVVAASVLGFLFVCCSVSLHMLRQMQRDFALEHQALAVLDNVVERLAVEPRRDLATVQRALTHEFQASELAAIGSARAETVRQGSTVELRVLGVARRGIATVRMPCRD